MKIRSRNKWKSRDEVLIKYYVAIITLIISLTLTFFSVPTILVELLCSHIRLNPFLSNAIVTLLLWIIPTTIGILWISSHIKDHRIRRKYLPTHFGRSYGIVKKNMIPAMKELCTRNDEDKNNAIDRFIQSPLEYVNEIVNDNKVPSFKPDDSSQDDMYNPDIKYIIAITAENPNLWMDPTYGFYIANCYAVSLVNQTNKALNEAFANNKRIKMTVENLVDLQETINERRKKIIDSFDNNDDNQANKTPINNFEFIRFFLFNEKQKESCENVVFPSLKAAQDLFRIHSFYINKDSMEEKYKAKTINGNSAKKQSKKKKQTNNNKWSEFSEIVARLWSLFENMSFDGTGAVKVLNNRKKNAIPEFLLLYYDAKIELHSFLDGNHVSKDITIDCKYSTFGVRDEKIKKEKVHEDISKLISSLASYVKENGYKDDLSFIGNHNMVNKQHTFINWADT